MLTGLAAVLAGLALAADGATITAVDFAFEPSRLTVRAGETVSFAIDDASISVHNVDFGDGHAYPAAASPPGPAWDGQRRTFDAPGEYPFVCAAHDFMTGVVTVVAADAEPVPTPAPDPQGAAPVEVRTLRAARRTFCLRRCARPGVRLRIDLSQPAAVAGTLTRRPPRGRARARRFGRVGFGTVAAGPRTLAFRRTAAGRRLARGRYALRLTIAGAGPRTLRFRVR